MTPKEEVEELMNAGLPLAERMLREHGEFYPYAVIRKSDGEIVHVGAQDKSTARPASSTLIDILEEAIRRQAEAGELAATALFFDVLVKPPGGESKGDAIQIALEHRSGYGADVYFPYVLATRNGEIAFGSQFAQGRSRTIFREAP